MRIPAGRTSARLAVGLAAAIVGVAALVVSLVEVAWPASVRVEHADAVLVHAASAERLNAGLALVEAGRARVLVVSDVGDGYGRSPAAMNRLCGRQKPYEVLCVPPQPGTTLGEARAFGRVADQRRWQRVAVVTDRWHLARAATSVRQCTDARVLPVAADATAGVSLARLVSEWPRTAATATLVRAC